MGPQGDVGPAGPRGLQGEIGPQGPQGKQGPRGYPASVNGIEPDSEGNITLTPPDIGAASNQNLLINWDFRKPVNRNGMSQYTGEIYAIDKWKLLIGASLSIMNRYIQLTRETAQWALQYYLDNDAILIGNVYTLSFLLKSNKKFRLLIYYGYNKYITKDFEANSELEMKEFIFTMPAPDSEFYISIIIQTLEADSIIDLIATKLELGSKQTLAHKDTSGNWIINDLLNYDLQYALCSQYSASTGEWIGNQNSNLNMMDNWYFPDPVNQMGLTEYTGNGYTIDRFGQDVADGSGTLQIEDGYIRHSKTQNITDNAGRKSVDNSIWHVFENAKALAGKTVTFSVLRRGTGTGALLLYTNSGVLRVIDGLPPSEGWDINSITATLPEDLNYLKVYSYSDRNPETTGYTDYLAAKLELGPRQTLAHQDAAGNWVLNDPPPNKALELAKCQRYLQILDFYEGVCISTATSNTFGSVQFSIPLPTTPRPNPNIIVGDYFRIFSKNLEHSKFTPTDKLVMGNRLYLASVGYASKEAYSLDVHPSDRIIIDAN